MVDAHDQQDRHHDREQQKANDDSGRAFRQSAIGGQRRGDPALDQSRSHNVSGQAEHRKHGRPRRTHMLPQQRLCQRYDQSDGHQVQQAKAHFFPFLAQNVLQESRGGTFAYPMRFRNCIESAVLLAGHTSYTGSAAEFISSSTLWAGIGILPLSNVSKNLSTASRISISLLDRKSV